MSSELELAACTPYPLHPGGFNRKAKLPHGLTTAHVHAAMNDFVNFLGFINLQLHTQEIERLETMLMPANFSSIVGEFMSSSIPKHCQTIVKNQHHSGHPDMIPKGRFPNDAVLHADEGVEVKASRYLKRWQGHNPEDTWLMVFVFDSNRPVDAAKRIAPRPFKFVMVVGARLTKEDWLFAGRSETSRRTITASVTKSGYEKMMANWIYKAPDLTQTEVASLQTAPPPSGLE
ncbi:MAG TPA: hypothetical protein VEX60_12545 [Pyrinomonadaceae bacterium]|nr:hypothetical protein [Pyrinomonadaceae bacterium]